MADDTDGNTQLRHAREKRRHAQREQPVITGRGMHALRQKFGAAEMSDGRGTTRARLLSRFVGDLASKKFGGIVMGYENVIYDTESDHTMPLKEITFEIARLLRGGIIVGIVSRHSCDEIIPQLRQIISQEYWGMVLVACCNGAMSCTLDEYVNDTTTSDHILESFLKSARLQGIISDYNIKDDSGVTIYPNQISIKRQGCGMRQIIRHAKQISAVKVLFSGGHADVISHETSRYGIVRAASASIQSDRHILCIGYSGQWPAADCELLTHRYSLSTGPVAATASSCWNLLPQDVEGEQGALEYLRCAAVAEDGSFSISM